MSRDSLMKAINSSMTLHVVMPSKQQLEARVELEHKCAMAVELELCGKADLLFQLLQGTEQTDVGLDVAVNGLVKLDLEVVRLLKDQSRQERLDHLVVLAAKTHVLRREPQGCLLPPPKAHEKNHLQQCFQHL